LRVDIVLGFEAFRKQEWPGLIDTLRKKLTLITGTDALR
jgi:hypothetical protein